MIFQIPNKWFFRYRLNTWLNIAALVAIHRLFTLFPTIYGFSDPFCVSVQFPVQNYIDACQLITLLSWYAWPIKADLFCSDKLEPCWHLVKGLSVMVSTSVLCFLVLCQIFSQCLLCKTCHSYYMELYKQFVISFFLSFICRLVICSLAFEVWVIKVVVNGDVQMW